MLILLPCAVSFWRVIILGGQRYLTIAVPALSLAAGLGMHSLLSRRGAAKALAVGALLIVVAAQSAYLVRYYGGREKRMWREAVAFDDTSIRTGDRVYVDPSYSQWVVDYYAGQPWDYIPPELMAAGVPGADRVWVLSISPGIVPGESALVSAGWEQRLNHPVFEVWASTLVRVSLYTAPER